MWQDDTARVLWQDQWDKGDEYALNMLAAHCPKCPARFVNNVHVRDCISRTLASPAAPTSTMPWWDRWEGLSSWYAVTLYRVKVPLMLKYKSPQNGRKNMTI